MADLVEEQGAALGGLEQADALGLGVGEAAALVAEQLGLDQGLGHRGAVHFEEGAVAEHLVEGPRDHALAGAGLAADQDRRPPARREPGLADPPRLLEGGYEGLVAPDEALGKGAVAPPQPGELAVAARARERALDEEPQLLEVEGLLQVVGGAAAHGFDGVGDRAVRRHQHHRRLRVEAAQALQHVEAALVRQPEVEEHEIRRRRLEGGDAGGAAHLDAHLVAGGRKGARNLAPEQGFVLDDEQAGHGRRG